VIPIPVRASGIAFFVASRPQRSYQRIFAYLKLPLVIRFPPANGSEVRCHAFFASSCLGIELPVSDEVGGRTHVQFSTVVHHLCRDPQRAGDFVLLFGDLFAQFVELFHVVAHGLRV